MTNDAKSPDSKPAEVSPPSRTTRLLTSWKLWTLVLVLALAGIAIVFVQPIVARKRAVEYFQRRVAGPEGQFELAPGAEEWTERYGEWGKAFQEVEILSATDVRDEDLIQVGILGDVVRLYLEQSMDEPHAVTDRGCAELWGMTGMTYLYLRGPGFSDEGVAGMLSSRPPLEHVRLSTPVGRETISALSRIPSIEYLAIPRGELTDDAFCALAPLPRLNEVVLSDVGDHGAQWLAQSPGLIFMTLSESTLTDAGLQRLGELQFLGTLIIEGAAITGDGLRQFAPSMACRRLAILECPHITPHDIALLPQLSQLEKLCLPEHLITPESVVRLKQMPRMTELICVGEIEDAELRQSITDAWHLLELESMPFVATWNFVDVRPSRQ